MFVDGKWTGSDLGYPPTYFVFFSSDQQPIIPNVPVIIMDETYKLMLEEPSPKKD